MPKPPSDSADPTSPANPRYHWARAEWVSCRLCAKVVTSPLVCPAPATGARCPFGLNGNRVQNPGCPRNGKQINTASGLLQYMQKASHWRSTWPRHRGARQRREGEAVGMGPRAPSHLPARIPACYLQHRPAGSSVMATGYAALSPHAHPPA